MTTKLATYLVWGGMVLGALLIVGNPAFARRGHDEIWCVNQHDKFSPDLQIGGCNALIHSGRLSRKNLAIVFNNRGNAYFRKNIFDQAIADYTQAIHLDHRYSYPYHNRGLAKFQRGKYRAAIADFSKAIRYNRKYASAYYYRGLAYAADGDHQTLFVRDPQTGDVLFNPATGKNPTTGKSIINDKGFARKKSDHKHAIADFSKAIRIDSKFSNPSTYFARARSEIEIGDPDAAIRDYTRAIKRNPGLIQAYLKRGDIYRYNKDDFAGMIANYTDAIRVNPKAVADYMIRDADLAYNATDYDRAIAAYTKAIQENPQFPGWYRLRGDVYREKADRAPMPPNQGRDELINKAIADYSELIRIAPNYELPYLKRARCYESQQNGRDAAIRDYSEAIRVNPRSVQAYQSRADLYRYGGQLDKAIADMTKAIQIAPTRDRYLHRAWAYEGENDYSHAIADYTNAIRLNPQNPGLYLSRGNDYFKEADPTLAAADYAKAAHLDPNATLKKAADLANSADEKQAIIVLDQLLDLKIDKPSAKATFLNTRCWARAVGGHGLSQALSDCNEAIRTNPKDADAFDSRAFVHLKRGEFKEAIADYDSALTLNSKLATSFYGRGIAEQKLGNKAGAETDIAKAKGLEPNVALLFEQYMNAPRGWLGAQLSSVTYKTAHRLGLESTQGALVVKTFNDSPASEAGIEPNDVILKFDGQTIKSATQLPKLIAATPGGKDVDVLIVRNAHQQNKIVKLGSKGAPSALQ